MENSIIIPHSLEVNNLQYANEKYDSFVDIHSPMLDVADFRVKRELPLNEECDAVFYEKTSHLKDTDYLDVKKCL